MQKTVTTEADKLPKEMLFHLVRAVELIFESFGIITKVARINKADQIEFFLDIKQGTAIDDILKHDKDIALGVASSTGKVEIIAPYPGTPNICIKIPYPTKRKLIGF